jgi:UDP-N-acetylglucosamine 2-epimerase
MLILTVVGTRPQLIKEAAIQPTLRRSHEEIFVDTGQHYDAELAQGFFAELGLAQPDHSLGIGGGSHASQVARYLVALEDIATSVQPDLVLTFGDTNSTLAAALTAAKLDLPIAHVEAGLRSFDRRMPEEVNRVVVDHLSTWLFAPTEAAVANLRQEGITAGVQQVGDVMQDLAAAQVERIRHPQALDPISRRLAREQGGAMIEPGRYIFATVHRAENRIRENLVASLDVLAALASPGMPVLLALHPGTANAMRREGLDPDRYVRIIPPVGYRTSLALQLHAAAVITDSGGVQREAAWLGTPCLVMRTTSEWVETLEGPRSTSTLIGRDPDRARAEFVRLVPPREAVERALHRAERLDLAPAGAADAITAALERPIGEHAP